MSQIDTIVLLVVLALIGYVTSAVVMLPLTRHALRTPGIASSVTKAMIGSRSWIAVYLAVILSAFLFHWNPHTVYVVLAGLLVVDAWGLLIWWLRWTRTRGKEIS